MSRHLVLIKGTEVHGPGLANTDETAINSQRITLPEHLTAEVLFVKNGTSGNVRNYLLSFLYQGDKKTQKKFKVDDRVDYVTLVSTPKHRHHICRDPRIVNAIYSVYRNFRHPVPEGGDRCSIHTFHRVSKDIVLHNIQAIVFFKKEVFCESAALGAQSGLLGLSMPHAVQLSDMYGIQLKSYSPDDGFYFLPVQKNTRSTCWCIQSINGFYTLVGKQFMNFMNRIYNLNDDEKTLLEAMIASLDPLEKEKMRLLIELFHVIYTWINFCCVLKQVTFVCMDELRNHIVTCPLLKCTQSPTAQEDSQEIVRKLYDLLVEYHKFINRVQAPDLLTYLQAGGVDPTSNCHLEVSFSYKCPNPRCGHIGNDERHIIKGGFFINPSVDRVQTPHDFNSAINSLVSTFDTIYCPRTGCGSLIKFGDYTSLEVLPCAKGSKHLISCQLNNDNRHEARGEWHIPLDGIHLGKNILNVNYICMNHANGNFGTNGHYTGALIVKDKVFFLDDGVHPIPIPDLTNVSKYAAYMVCTVTGHLDDSVYSDFRARVEDRQLKEHSILFADKIVNTVEGINNNLIPRIEEANQTRREQPTDIHFEDVKQKVRKLLERMDEARKYILEYNSAIPENNRVPAVEIAARQLDTLQPVVSELGTEFRIS